MTTPACTERLTPGGLQCTRPAGHPHGHTYVAAWLADGTHDDHTHEED